MPNRLRKLHGQDWEVAVEVGHSLRGDDRKTVGRVMALDPGVGAGLDIVVATASLEVGFNDPKVGAVIQHKAPRDVAQFLQRKGYGSLASDAAVDRRRAFRLRPGPCRLPGL